MQLKIVNKHTATSLNRYQEKEKVREWVFQNSNPEKKTIKVFLYI